MALKIIDSIAIIKAAIAILFALLAEALALRARLSCSTLEASACCSNHVTAMARSLPKYTLVARFARTCAAPRGVKCRLVRAILFFRAIEHEDEESFWEGSLFHVRVPFKVLGELCRCLPHRRFPLALATDAFLKA